MKKQAKGIIALSAVLAALLGGGYAYMKLTPEDSGGNGGSSNMELLATTADGEGTVLVSDNGSEEGVVKKAVITNDSGKLTVVRKSAPAEDGNAPAYTLDGFTDLKVDEMMVSTLVNNGNGLTAKSAVARGCDDVSKYGLDKPEATVEIDYESGNTVKFLVGDKTPSGESVYVMVDGSRDVYSVAPSLVSNYSKTVKDFISTTILEKPADGTEPDVKSLRVERDDLKDGFYLEYDNNSGVAHSGGTSSSYKMHEPTESYLTVERSTDVITGMFGLSASDIYVMHCKEDDIKNAGLSKPFCKVDCEMKDGKKYELLLSEVFADNSGKKCCYGMLGGDNVIYIISEDKAPWLTVQPIDVASRMLITSYVWNITDMTVSSGSEKAEFVITQNEPGKKLDSPQSEDFKATYNGKEIDAERYRQFYAFLNGANAEEFALGAPVPAGEPMASIKFNDSYRGKTETYEFYDDSVMRVLIVVDGKSKYYCTKSFVSVLTDNIRKIDGTDDFVTTW